MGYGDYSNKDMLQVWLADVIIAIVIIHHIMQ